MGRVVVRYFQKLITATACLWVRHISQSVMSAAARIVCGLKKYDHITSHMWDSLHWLRVPQPMIFKSVMSAAARIVCGLKKYDHITSHMWDSLHWLRVPQPVMFKFCLLIYKSLHGCAPDYLTELCNLVAWSEPLTVVSMAWDLLLPILTLLLLEEYVHAYFSEMLPCWPVFNASTSPEFFLVDVQFTWFLSMIIIIIINLTL